MYVRREVLDTCFDTQESITMAQESAELEAAWPSFPSYSNNSMRLPHVVLPTT